MSNWFNENRKWQIETVEKLAEYGFEKYGYEFGGQMVHHYWYSEQLDATWGCKVRDYEYTAEYDNEILYDLPWSSRKDEIEKMLRRRAGVVQVGDTIEVFKGRKVPKGTIAKVVSLKDWHDQYGRWRCTYAHLDDGQRTNVSNCRIVYHEGEKVGCPRKLMNLDEI